MLLVNSELAVEKLMENLPTDMNDLREISLPVQGRFLPGPSAADTPAERPLRRRVFRARCVMEIKPPHGEVPTSHWFRILYEGQTFEHEEFLYVAQEVKEWLRAELEGSGRKEEADSLPPAEGRFFPSEWWTNMRDRGTVMDPGEEQDE